MCIRRHARSWRWHKKLQIWLTKDEHLMPQQISPTVERGFYIIWDPIRFQRDRVRLECSHRGSHQSSHCVALVANESYRGNSLSTTATSTRLSGKERNERIAQHAALATPGPAFVPTGRGRSEGDLGTPPLCSVFTLIVCMFFFTSRSYYFNRQKGVQERGGKGEKPMEGKGFFFLSARGGGNGFL